MKMRPINKIIVLNTKTKETLNVKASDIISQSAEEGLSIVGYHFIVERGGVKVIGRSLNTIGFYMEEEDAYSIGIAYIGGLDREGNPKDTRTAEQINTINEIIEDLKVKVPEARDVYMLNNEFKLIKYE